MTPMRAGLSRPRRASALRRGILLAAASVWLALLASPAAAQYFGRNKVQYSTFHWQILRTDHFDVYFYPAERALAEQAGRMAERWYGRLAHALGYELSSRQALILYASHPDFEQTNAIPGELGEGTGGVTEALKRRIVLPAAGPISETDHVIGHELVHAFQYDVTGQRSSTVGFAAPAILRLPLWFVEGMAEYLSVGPVDPHTAMWIRDAAETGKLPTIRKLGDPRYFPYRYGQALWAYVAHRWGEAAIARCLRSAGRSGDAELALSTELGISVDSLSLDWHRAIRAWYAPVASVARPAAEFGRQLESVQRAGGDLHLAPALSPDGRRLVYFSEKDLFSIEMYLADIERGRVERRLTKAALDPHLESLEFIQSAGAWSPDGRRFAYTEISKGKPRLVILDVDRQRKLQEIELAGLGEVLNPTWSPDGGRVALSALVGGVTDLYTVDLGTRQVRRLTDDLYADLQPAWSPDGGAIVFVTDRYTTDIEALRYGRQGLALLDLATGGIRPLPAYEDAKNINPQWSGDGRSIYFVSDHGGISNVHRLAVASGEVSQVTSLRTGVSGITALSPAISLARDAGRLVFTAYEKGAYHLYAMDSGPALEGTAPAGSLADAARLPGGEVVTPVPPDSAFLHRPPLRTGLPDVAGFRARPYKAGLSLDYIAQPNVSIGASTSGVAAGGGAALFLSDMLGDHGLGTFLQVSTGGGSLWRNTALGAFYENRRTRWNWGLGASQVPLITREFGVDFGSFNGEPATREIERRRWEIYRDVQGIVAYPLSRAQRLEIGGGFRNVDFAGEVDTVIFSDVTGAELYHSTGSLDTDTIPSLNFGTGNLALVYDNSIFGGTSPVLGQRYRFEAGLALGSINYASALADYRRYVPLARPLVLAGRVLHYGRYGAGGEDRRLQELFLGYGWLMRGYNDGSFGPEECDELVGDCPDFDRLFGSRLAIANLELRLPLLGPVGLVPSRGFLPVEIAAFYDAGVAWTRGEKLWLDGGERDPVTSYGAALRVNLLGFAVGEVDFVHPNDRPKKDWYWQFTLTPGF